MALSDELKAPPLDSDRVAELTSRMWEIADLVEEEGFSDGARAAVAALNADTGQEFFVELFHDGICGSSAEELAVRAARPAPRRIPGITRDDLVELLRAALDVGDEGEHDYYLALYKANVLDPRALDYVFWPEDKELTVEEAVDRALQYKPIAL